jgi:hypothetical protein
MGLMTLSEHDPSTKRTEIVPTLTDVGISTKKNAI